jgi:hypothetical protein
LIVKIGPLFFVVGPANSIWRPQFAGSRWSCSYLSKGAFGQLNLDLVA